MKHRILFVEDDYMTIANAVTYLELEGHEVHVCDEVDTALARLRYECFSIIFLDVMLPPGNQFSLTETADGRYTGLRLLEKIFSDDLYIKARECRWLLSTNWRDEPEVDSVAQKTGAGILRKPLSIQTIEDALKL